MGLYRSVTLKHIWGVCVGWWRWDSFPDNGSSWVAGALISSRDSGLMLNVGQYPTGGTMWYIWSKTCWRLLHCCMQVKERRKQWQKTLLNLDFEGFRAFLYISGLFEHTLRRWVLPNFMFGLWRHWCSSMPILCEWDWHLTKKFGLVFGQMSDTFYCEFGSLYTKNLQLCRLVNFRTHKWF